jgi:hypothetical protein
VARALRANFGWQRDAAPIGLDPMGSDTRYKRANIKFGAVPDNIEKCYKVEHEEE